MKLAIISLLALSLCACAQLGRIQDKGSDYAAKAINEYCSNTDAAFRQKFRIEVNAKAFPNSAAIECNSGLLLSPEQAKALSTPVRPPVQLPQETQ